MAEETGKGFWSRLFGTKHSGCCDLNVEEVAEGSPQEPGEENTGTGGASAGEQSQTAAGTPRNRTKPCCGGGSTPSSGGCCG
jgi:hypothetical protein